MKILHTISGLGIKSGGPSQSVYYTVKGLQTPGCEADILTYASDDDQFVSNNDYIIALQCKKRQFAYSANYRKYIQNNICDIYHTQGIWEYPTYIGAKTARKKNKPYIITPRGMLYPQALAISSLKKKIALKLFLKKDLNKAAAIQATCIEELKHLRNLGITSPIAVVSNPVSISETQNQVSPSTSRIGYLGRIHSRKNVERIFYALDKLNSKKTEVLVIGDGDDFYMQFLKKESKRLNINVIFTGFLDGEEKKKLYNLCHI